MRPLVSTSTVPSSFLPTIDAVGRRRLGELVDLVAQGGDVLARLAQRVAELLVLGDRLGQLTLGLEQPLFEGAQPLGGVGQAAAQLDDLLVEDGCLRTQDLDGLVIGLCHGSEPTRVDRPTGRSGRRSGDVPAVHL